MAIRQVARCSPFVVAILLIAAAATSCKMPSDSTKETITTIDASGPSDATAYGTVAGYVVDGAGKPLAGISVTYNTGVNSKALGAVLTDANGWFEASGLISGDHTIKIGNGTASTTQTLSVTVPKLADLKNDSTQVPIYDENGNVIQSTSLLKQYNGHYFVNITASKIVVYPCTSTLTGTAYIKISTSQLDSEATLAPTGTKVIAEFADWNGGSTLQFQGTVSGSAGGFAISNVPAIFNSFAAVDGSIGLYLVSEDGNTSALDSYVINGTDNNTTGASAVDTGALLGADTRNVGKRYFVAAVAPKVVATAPAQGNSNAKFDPGTSGSPVPLVFTFDKAMNPSRGTLAVKDNDATPQSYVFGTGWTAGNTVLTVTPAATNPVFEYGKTITATFTGFESADGVAFGGGPFVFYVRDALALVSSNTYSPYGTGASNLEFPVASSVVLTYNAPIASPPDPTGTYLEKGTTGQIVPTTPSLDASGAILTLAPASSLEYDTDYRVHYKVTGALFNRVDVLDTSTTPLTFHTVKKAVTLTAPTVSLDNARNYILHGARNNASFDFGDASFWILFSKVTDADEYYLQYKLASDVPWITYGTALKTASSAADYETSTTCSSQVAMSNLAVGYKSVESGKPIDLRILAKTADGRASIVSASVPLADSVAPTVGTLTLTRARTSGNPNNISGNSPYAIYTITRSTTEPLRTPVAGDITAPTNATVSSVGLNTAGDIVIVFSIAATADATGGTASIVVVDKAGNVYDNDTGTNGNQPFQFTLN